MKVELIKQIKENGDVFYTTFVEGIQIGGTVTYAGTLIEEREGAVDKAIVKFNMVKEFFKEGKIPSENIVLSEEI